VEFLVCPECLRRTGIVADAGHEHRVVGVFRHPERVVAIEFLRFDGVKHLFGEEHAVCSLVGKRNRGRGIDLDLLRRGNQKRNVGRRKRPGLLRLLFGWLLGLSFQVEFFVARPGVRRLNLVVDASG
jgi:hypothetical protein